MRRPNKSAKAIADHDIIVIDWDDAWMAIGSPDESYNFRQRSVGWRVKAPRGCVRIAMSINSDGAEECLTVPNAMVRSITVLRKAGKSA